MINRIPFCFGNLMVRRKKIHKGCKESPKRLQKEPQLPCLLCKFYKKTGFSCTFQKIIVYLRHILKYLNYDFRKRIKQLSADKHGRANR